MAIKISRKDGVEQLKNSNGLMTIFDVQKKEYRMVNLETLYAMRIQGVEYEIVD